MRFPPVFTLVLVTVASWTLLCHAAPVELLSRQSQDLIESISPKDGSMYELGSEVIAQVRVKEDAELEDDTPIQLTFQRAIPKPDVNIDLGEVELSELRDVGKKITLTEEHQGDLTKSNRYRIRYSFRDSEDEFHYFDSGVFHINRPSS
ncbi:hypothetical protein EC968_009477 [Mortierella alpina]|nr:hypothetical protein EC968_009477 [Mortierella alpina]